MRKLVDTNWHIESIEWQNPFEIRFITLLVTLQSNKSTTFHKILNFFSTISSFGFLSFQFICCWCWQGDLRNYYETDAVPMFVYHFSVYYWSMFCRLMECRGVMTQYNLYGRIKFERFEMPKTNIKKYIYFYAMQIEIERFDLVDNCCKLKMEQKMRWNHFHFSFYWKYWIENNHIAVRYCYIKIEITA